MGHSFEDLLNRAMNLANSNDHFGPNFSTAEPFFYFARLNNSKDTNILCLIGVYEYIKGNPRFDDWADWALARLDSPNVCEIQ
jgi:hypothetical protein